MNKIEQLIQQLCPNGVEFTEIGKIGDFYGGLTGKSKNDFQDGNAKFVTYMNVFSNIAVKTDIDIFVKIGEKENQNRVEYGDVLFTGSSETPDECGMSSVLTEKITEPLYLNSFCFGFRLHDKELFLPDFLKYLFRDDSIRKQIVQTASGVTRFNISKKRFAKVIIPIPPLPIQQEIVTILDSFTQLEAELEAELEARKKQYEYYRNELLNFEGKDVAWKTLVEACDYVDYRGKTPKKTKEGIFLVTAKNIRKGHIDYITSQEFISKADYNLVMRRGLPKLGDVLITTEAPCGFVAQVDRENIALAQRVIKYRSKVKSLSNSFLKHYMLGNEFQNKLEKTATGSTVKGIKGSKLHKLTIPIPPLSEQERIVGILDKFDALVNDISQGLPAEIEARRKQYEYYRGKLLSFDV
jgi:type I restriction enzyme S subunit